MSATPKKRVPQRAPKKPRSRKAGEVNVQTSITPAAIEAIVGALRSGATMETAFAYAKVPASTARVWLRNGRAELAPIYVDFVEQLDLAIADGKMRDLVRIDHHADKDWRAAAWKLERRFPSEFGETIRSDVTVQARPFVDVSKLTLEEQQQLLELLRKGAPDQEALPKDGDSALALMPGPAVEAA